MKDRELIILIRNELRRIISTMNEDNSNIEVFNQLLNLLDLIENGE